MFCLVQANLVRRQNMTLTSTTNFLEQRGILINSVDKDFLQVAHAG